MADPTNVLGAVRVQGLPAPRSLTVRMDVTNRCNLDCVQCTLASSRELVGESPGDMPVELFRKVAREVFPYASMVALSCEAEPTVHGDFSQLLEIIREAGTTCVMTTNGTTLTRRKINEILDSGLAGINLSIDGATEETFARIRRPGRLDRVIQAVLELNRLKDERGLGTTDAPQLQINTTLMRSTVDELPALVELCRQWRAHRLTVQHIYATEETGLGNESMLHDMERSDAVLERCRELCGQYGIETTFPPLFLAPAPVASCAPVPAQAASCLAPWSMLRIMWNGVVAPCDQWRRAPFGDLRSASFEEIWNGPEAVALREAHARHQPQHASCLSCSLVTTDNLERRPERGALVLTGSVAAARYLDDARAALAGASGADTWPRLAPVLRLLARDRGVEARALHEAIEARSWEGIEAAAARAQDAATLLGLGYVLREIGRREQSLAVVSRCVERGGPLARDAMEELSLHEALQAAERGDHAAADAHAMAALRRGSSMRGQPLDDAQDGVAANLPRILSHCTLPYTLTTLAELRMARGDAAGSAALLRRYLEVQPRAIDRSRVERLLVEGDLRASLAATERGDAAEGDALAMKALRRIFESEGEAPASGDDDAVAANIPRLLHICITPFTLSTLANIRLRRGDRDGAVRLFRRYLEVDPATADRDAVRETIARVDAERLLAGAAEADRRGQRTEADELARRAFVADGGSEVGSGASWLSRVRHGTTLLGYGSLLLQRQDWQGAMAVFDAYASAHPDAPDAAAARGLVEQLRSQVRAASAGAAAPTRPALSRAWGRLTRALRAGRG